MPKMVAVSVKNCAHIISTPAAMSWSLLITKLVKAKATAAKKLHTATNFSCLRLFIMHSQSIGVRHGERDAWISPARNTLSRIAPIAPFELMIFRYEIQRRRRNLFAAIDISYRESLAKRGHIRCVAINTETNA